MPLKARRSLNYGTPCRLKIAVFEAGVPVWPRISGRKGCPLATIIRVRKLDEPTFHMYKNVGRGLLRFVTIHAFDRQTDGQTDRCSWQYRGCMAAAR